MILREASIVLLLTIIFTPTIIAATYSPKTHEIYIGYEGDDMSENQLQNFASAMGKTPYLYGFFQWFNGGSGNPSSKLKEIESLCDRSICRGVIMSWQPLDRAYTIGGDESLDTTTIDRINAGYYDNYITTVAQAFHNFPYTKLITFGCEVNGQWIGYGYSATAYKNAWHHVVDIFKENNAKVDFVYQPVHAPENNNEHHYPNRGYIQDYYPGDDYVDWLSVSCHGSVWVNFGTVQEAFSQTNYLTLCTTTNKPFIFSEMGAAPDWNNPTRPTLDDRVAWLNSFFEFCNNQPSVKGFVYYDYDQTTLLSEPSLADTFKNAITDNTYIGGNQLDSTTYTQTPNANTTKLLTSVMAALILTLSFTIAILIAKKRRTSNKSVLHK